MLKIEVELQGTNRLQRKLRPDKLIGPAQKRMLEQMSVNLERTLRTYSPRETSYMAGNWNHVMDVSRIPTWSKISTPALYARPLEYSGKSPRGTGRIPFFRPAIADFDRDGPIAEAAKAIEREWGS